MKTSIRTVLAALGLLASLHAAAAPVVQSTNYITAPAHFNGFEGMPQSEGNGASYTEDGITVRQVNGQSNDIWSGYTYWGAQGNYAWYPSGGDYGYTSVTMSDGSQFSDIGFLVGSGYGSGAHWLFYELVLGGDLVQSGTLTHTSGNWLGFSGGGFDEVRLRDSYGPTSSLADGQLNALALDSIKVSAANTVPEPASLALVLGGLGIVGTLRRRRR